MITIYQEKMKIWIIIGLCMILVGCSSKICPLGWSNETHFCNEYHYPERRHQEFNTSEWELTWLNDSEYVDCCMDKQFEEIPDDEIYCKTITEYDSYCDWNKGRDEKWREYCHGYTTYREICYNKTNDEEIFNRISAILS